MTPRWNWDFEDARRAPARSRSTESPGPPPPQSPLRIRRRRGVAAGVLVALLALLLVASLSGSPSSSPAPAASRPHTGVLALTPVRNDPENNQRTTAAVLGYTPFVKEGALRGREIALTFDDGPGPYTPQILSVLEQLHVHATFFVIGKMLRYFSAAAARAVQDGDVIGDHTQSHPALATLSAHDQREELFEQIARVELLGAARPTLFRPPYGSFNATTIRELRALHLLMVLWSVDTEDYLQPGVSTIVQRALAGAHPGAILLMHDAGGTRTQTIEALPLIIHGLRARGYRLVTIPRLLKDDPPPAGLPLPPNLSGD